MFSKIEDQLGQLICTYTWNCEDEVHDMARKGLLGAIYGLPRLMPVRDAVDWVSSLQEEAMYPVLIASDFETGTIDAIKDATELPMSMAIGATGNPKVAYEVAEILGKEMRILGYHLVGGPVVDVNTNPRNPIINIRAFGDDVDLVTKMGVSYVKGVQGQGVYACCKHFPGHGDTDMDSHRALPTIRHSLERMWKVELKPYVAAIRVGLKAVMTAHIVFSSIDAQYPATLSKNVLTELLRKQMGFRGLIITDAFDMYAIKHNYEFDEAVILAVNAGADLLLVSEPQRTLDVLMEAFRSGKIDGSRVQESVSRILAAKRELGLFGPISPKAEAAEKLVGCQEHIERALNIERRAVVVNDPEEILPIQKKRKKVGLATVANYRDEKAEVSPTHLSDGGLALEDQLANLQLDQVFHLGISNPQTAKDLLECDTILMGVFARMGYKSEEGNLSNEQKEFVEKLLTSGRKTFLISFGNPYPLGELRGLRGYGCTFGEGQIYLKVAQEVITGKCIAQGRLPINLCRDSSKSG